jgi:hypothetical protein
MVPPDRWAEIEKRYPYPPPFDSVDAVSMACFPAAFCGGPVILYGIFTLDWTLVEAGLAGAAGIFALLIVAGVWDHASKCREQDKKRQQAFNQSQSVP